MIILAVERWEREQRYKATMQRVENWVDGVASLKRKTRGTGSEGQQERRVRPRKSEGEE
jgi:hypothetical protein